MRALYFCGPINQFNLSSSMKHPLLLSLLLVGSSLSATSQESFALIHSMLQTRCSGNGCHNGSTPTFNVDQGTAELYADLVNVDPINPTALSKGNKLIRPGYPTKSFLLRKVAHGLSDVLELQQPQEGSHMPSGGAALADNEVELIRQWIIFGAPETGEVVDTALINTYYREGGIDDTYADHEAPDPSEGFQMYMGRIFVPPLTEFEYYMKFDPEIATDIEVHKIETYMAEGAHHFVIYSFNPGAEEAYVDGLRDAYDPGAQDSHADIKNPITTGSGLWSYQLPQGTAYYWPANTVFDMNIHIKNDSPDSIMSTDLYMNIYTQPAGTTNEYMQVRLFPILDISIPQDNQEHTFTEVANQPNADKTWKIWNIYTHTHKYGTGYDVYERNPDGTAGEWIYDGDYSYELDFLVGFYRTGPEVTFRFFPDNELYEIDPRIGLIHEARFLNTNGPDPVLWGLTSDEEMMVLGIQYVEGADLTGIEEVAPIEGLHVFPNPTDNVFSVNFKLLEDAEVLLEVFDLSGKRISLLHSSSQLNGMFTATFNARELGIVPGIYLLNITVNGGTVTHKLVING